MSSGTEFGFSVRRFALAILILIAVRGAFGLVSAGNRLAGISAVVFATLLACWLFLRYVDLRSEE